MYLQSVPSGVLETQTSMKWCVVICFAFLCSTTGVPVEDAKDKDILIVAPLPTDVPTEDDSNSTNTRIIGGQATTIERFPYAVQVLHNRNLACGGSLLTRRHVLSAAHCFFDANGLSVPPSRYTVRVGSANLGSGGSTKSVSTVVVHERYNIPLRDNDVAVMVLSSRVTLGSRVALATIPRQGSEVPDNAPVVHIGWGQTNVNVQQASSVLQEVTIRTINLGTCTQRYTYLSQIDNRPYIVTTNMICSGLLDIGGADACQGDSGGPLIYQGVVVGVTSWGYGCAHPSYPGVNAKVAAYTNWINQTVTRYGGAGPISSSSSIFLITLSLLASIVAAS